MRISVRVLRGRGIAGAGRRLRAERGAALVEIMVGALLTALVATAVFKGIDGASAVSGGSKSRAIAATVAEQDQERLRATAPASLVDLNQSRTEQRNGVDYTVASTSRWVADREVTPDCSSATSRAGYLQIVSRVTWADMRGSRPIVASSLVSPPNGTVTTNRGAIGVRVLDNANQGVPGVSVDVSGPGLSGTTNADGCVFFDDIPEGNYSYSASKAGFVDHSGNQIANRPIGVSAGQTRIETVYLDAAVGMSARLVTRRYGGPQIQAELTEALPLHLANSKMSALNGLRSEPSSTSSTRSVSGLFPMAYGVFAGPCSPANNPAQYGTPFEVNTPYPAPVDVFLPAINVRGRISGTYTNGATIKFTLLPVTGSTCTATYTRTTQNVAGVGDGAIARPEFPYGRYTVCGEAQFAGIWYHASRTVDNTSTAGVTVLLDDGIAQLGRCP